MWLLASEVSADTTFALMAVVFTVVALSRGATVQLTSPDSYLSRDVTNNQGATCTAKRCLTSDVITEGATLELVRFYYFH